MDYSPPGSSVHGDSPGKSTGVVCQALLQGIFPTQGSNPGLPPCRQILYLGRIILRHLGSPGIKITGTNISNLIYADDTTLMTESKEALKSLLMKVEGKSEKADLKVNIQKMKIMASCPITSWEKDRETMETKTDFIFLVCKITADGDHSHEVKRC